MTHLKVTYWKNCVHLLAYTTVTNLPFFARFCNLAILTFSKLWTM